MPTTQYSGGSVKIADSTVFDVATEVAVAEVTVEPGAMRELHWHPTQNEWGFFLCVRLTSSVTEINGTGAGALQRRYCTCDDFRSERGRPDF